MNKVRYIAAGNVMIDDVLLNNGVENRIQLGGPSIFAFAGIKLWTDDCLLVANVGKDFEKYYGSWMDTNKNDWKGITIATDHTTHNYLRYLEDGTYTYNENMAEQDRMHAMQEIGLMKTRGEQIEPFIDDLEGMYIAYNSDSVFWDHIARIKLKRKFKVMWEIEITSCNPNKRAEFDYALQQVDIFSINLYEAQQLFAEEHEAKIIQKIQKLPVDVTLFRVGERGLYTINKHEVIFHPSINTTEIVDPTGSGNCSTGSALYSYASGDSLAMIGVKANIASAINLKSFGVIPNLLDQRENAHRIAKEVYDRQFTMEE